MLSSEDFVGRCVHGSTSRFEMLVDVAEVAAEKYVQEKAFMKQIRALILKKKLLKKQAPKTDHDRDIFVAGDPWRRVPSHASSSRRKQSYEQLSDMGDTDSKGWPELPDHFKNRIKAMDGTEVVMVIQKALTATDVNKCQARLSMPFRQVNMDFLREGERVYLRRQNEMKATFIEPSAMFGEIVLRQWDMRKSSGKTSSMYVLRKWWHDVTLKNDLQDGDVVQVWSFRVGNEEQRLYLALVVVSRKKNRR